MFRVGQRCICIRVRRPAGSFQALPVKGRIYTVGWVGYVGNSETIDLVELPSPESYLFHRGYEAKYFRPIVERKTDISIFREILRKATKRADTGIGASA